jgi:hypothetical protein
LDNDMDTLMGSTVAIVIYTPFMHTNEHY